MANNTSSKLDNSEFWQMCHDFHYNMPSTITFDDNEITESGDDSCLDADGFVYPPKAHSSPAKIVGVAIKRSLKNTVDLATLNRTKYYDNNNSEMTNLVLLDSCCSAPISHECDQLEDVEVFYECSTDKNGKIHDNNNNNENFIQMSSNTNNNSNNNDNDTENDSNANETTTEKLLNISHYSTADEIDASFNGCENSLENLFLKKSAENSEFLKNNGYCVNTQKIIETIKLINDCDLIKSEIDEVNNGDVKVKSPLLSLEKQCNVNNRKLDDHLNANESVEKREKPTNISLLDKNEGINKLNGNDSYSNSNRTDVDLINDNLFDSVSEDIKKLKVSVQAVNDELEKTRKSNVIDDGQKESVDHEHNHFEISDTQSELQIVADCNKAVFKTDAELNLQTDLFSLDGKCVLFYFLSRSKKKCEV